MNRLPPSEANRLMCMKCKQHVAVIDTRDSPYCKDCFTENLEYRVRNALNSKQIPNNSRGLLAISGGSGSRALMHAAYLFQSMSKKVHDQNPDFKDVIAHVRELAASYGLEFVVIPIVEHQLCGDSGISLAATEAFSSYDLMTAAADQFKFQSGTLSNDAIDEIEALNVENHLRRAALSMGYNCIIYGSNCTRSACDVLMDIAKGRGASLPKKFDTRESDRYSSDGILTLRPLVGFVSKEISMYNHIKKLNTKTTRLNVINRCRRTTSNAIKDFVLRSESANPTASTVVVSIASRTKMLPPEFFSGKCGLCGGLAESNARGWIAEKCASDSHSECIGDLKNTPQYENRGKSHTCYSCIRLIQDCSVLPSVVRRRERAKLRAISSSQSLNASSCEPTANNQAQQRYE